MNIDINLTRAEPSHADQWVKLFDSIEAPVLDVIKVGGTGYLDSLTLSDLTNPVMVGRDEHGRRFIAVMVEVDHNGDDDTRATEKQVITFFQRYVDDPGFWVMGTSGYHVSPAVFDRIPGTEYKHETWGTQFKSYGGVNPELLFQLLTLGRVTGPNMRIVGIEEVRLLVRSRWMVRNLIDDHRHDEVHIKPCIVGLMVYENRLPVTVSFGRPSYSGYLSINSVGAPRLHPEELHLSTESVSVLNEHQLLELKEKGTLNFEDVNGKGRFILLPA